MMYHHNELLYLIYQAKLAIITTAHLVTRKFPFLFNVADCIIILLAKGPSPILGCQG